MGRQDQPLGLFLLGGGRCLRLRQCIDLAGHGRQVGFGLVFEQALLFRVEALGLRRKLHALQVRILVRELVDDGLLEGQILVLGRSCLQHGGQRSVQLLCTQAIQRLRLDQLGVLKAFVSQRPRDFSPSEFPLCQKKPSPACRQTWQAVAAAGSQAGGRSRRKFRQSPRLHLVPHSG